MPVICQHDLASISFKLLIEISSTYLVSVHTKLGHLFAANFVTFKSYVVVLPVEAQSKVSGIVYIMRAKKQS